MTDDGQRGVVEQRGEAEDDASSDTTSDGNSSSSSSEGDSGSDSSGLSEGGHRAGSQRLLRRESDATAHVEDPVSGENSVPSRVLVDGPSVSPFAAFSDAHSSEGGDRSRAPTPQPPSSLSVQMSVPPRTGGAAGVPPIAGLQGASQPPDCAPHQPSPPRRAAGWTFRSTTATPSHSARSSPAPPHSFLPPPPPLPDTAPLPTPKRPSHPSIPNAASPSVVSPDAAPHRFQARRSISPTSSSPRAPPPSAAPQGAELAATASVAEPHGAHTVTQAVHQSGCQDPSPLAFADSQQRSEGGERLDGDLAEPCGGFRAPDEALPSSKQLPQLPAIRTRAISGSREDVGPTPTPRSFRAPESARSLEERRGGMSQERARGDDGQAQRAGARQVPRDTGRDWERSRNWREENRQGSSERGREGDSARDRERLDERRKGWQAEPVRDRGVGRGGEREREGGRGKEQTSRLSWGGPWMVENRHSRPEGWQRNGMQERGLRGDQGRDRQRPDRRERSADGNRNSPGQRLRAHQEQLTGPAESGRSGRALTFRKQEGEALGRHKDTETSRDEQSSQGDGGASDRSGMRRGSEISGPAARGAICDDGDGQPEEKRPRRDAAQLPPQLPLRRLPPAGHQDQRRRQHLDRPPFDCRHLALLSGSPQPLDLRLRIPQSLGLQSLDRRHATLQQCAMLPVSAPSNACRRPHC